MQNFGCKCSRGHWKGVNVELAAGLIVLIDPFICNYSSNIITVIHTLVLLLYSITAVDSHHSTLWKK